MDYNHSGLYLYKVASIKYSMKYDFFFFIIIRFGYAIIVIACRVNIAMCVYVCAAVIYDS